MRGHWGHAEGPRWEGGSATGLEKTGGPAQAGACSLCPSGAHGLDDAHCAGRGTCLQSPPRQRPTLPGTPLDPDHVFPALLACLPSDTRQRVGAAAGRRPPGTPGLCATRTHRSGLGTGQGSGPQRGISLQACRVTPAFDPSRGLPRPAPPPTLAAEEVRCLGSGCWLQACLQQLLEPFPRDRWFGLCLLSSPLPLPDAWSRTADILAHGVGAPAWDNGALEEAGTALSSRETLSRQRVTVATMPAPMLSAPPVSKPVPEPAKGPAARPVEPVSCINTFTPAAASLGS